MCKPAGDPRTVAEAARLLAGAERPIIIGGGGLRWGNGGDALKSLVEKTKIPFILLNEGRGTVPDEHPLSLGTGG